jgi:hypothetical protein
MVDLWNVNTAPVKLNPRIIGFRSMKINAGSPSLRSTVPGFSTQVATLRFAGVHFVRVGPQLGTDRR